MDHTAISGKWTSTDGSEIKVSAVETHTGLSETEENAVARKNAILYAILQSINGAAAPVSIALGGIAGASMLGPDKSLATAPITGFNLGVALMAVPAAMLMKNIGRRYGFMTGALIGIFGMLLAVKAIYAQSFWLFALSLAMVGAANSFTQQYRFAAADRGTKKIKAKAISWVLIGGVAASVVGPQLILHTKDYLEPIPFAGAYLWAAGLFGLSLIVMQFLEPGHPPVSEAQRAKGSGRPLMEIISQPRFIVAVLCGTSSYALMSYMMTAAPLAMLACGFDVTDSTWGIQWHVLAMFVPSFFTGNLIQRFGKERIVATGLAILIACAIVALNGVTLSHFYVALILLGIGWNFGFIGSTAMVTDTYEPHEKNKAQGANDFILFGTVAAASFLSGWTLNHYGWDFMNYLVFPVIAVSMIALGWLVLQKPNEAR